MKNIIIPAVAVLAIIGAIIYFGGLSKKETTSPSMSPSPPTNQIKVQNNYFDDNARVMFFYSESCGWCQKQKTVLADLAKEGYKVKPMNVGVHQEYWTEYQIQGTPTFIGPDGLRLIGYQTKDKLKDFLDKYK